MIGEVIRNSDHYFDDTPWEIFYDDNGHVIGELFLYSEPEYDRPRKRRRSKK